MRVLLTGGAPGFIGPHITEQLLASGHEVAVVDDLSSGKRENVPDGARFYGKDVRSGCAGSSRISAAVGTPGFTLGR